MKEKIKKFLKSRIFKYDAYEERWGYFFTKKSNLQLQIFNGDSHIIIILWKLGKGK